MTDNPSHQQLQLDISADSRIANVTVYPDGAEVTRIFHLQLEAGKTAVTLTGGFPYMKTPPVFSRLEKEGDVTLHDVEITETSPGSPPPQIPTSAPHALEEEKELLQASLSRCELSLLLLNNYVKQMDLQQRESIKTLNDVLEAYDQQCHKWDKKIQELKRNIRDVENEIEEAQNPAADPTPVQAEGPLSTNHRVQFSLEADSAAGVELRLAYYTTEASWIAEYDIAVTSTRSEDEMKLDLTYKAVISNDTVEAWENVNLRLELKPPSKQIRELSPWILAFDNSENVDVLPRTIPNFSHNLADKVSIPEGAKKTVRIAQIQPLVLFERSCTPAVDFKVRVEGHITNNTEYPFHSGSANIYLEGNYYARTHLGAIAVGEAWSIPLGFDDKVRVTYPPYTKTTEGLDGNATFVRHNCHRRITVSNTRKITIASLIIIDNFSRGGQGSGISSWLITPVLKQRSRREERSEASVALTDGIPKDSYVSAKWDRSRPKEGPEELDLVRWECKVGPSREIPLDLIWTVSTSRFESIRGLQ